MNALALVGVALSACGCRRVTVRAIRAAAARRYAAAEYAMGWLYAHGRGVPQDMAEAARWYRRAAGQRYRPAEVVLGRMLQDGIGVAKDRVEAHMWFNLAAADGHHRAAELREGIEAFMDAAQIAEAQRRARELDRNL